MPQLLPKRRLWIKVKGIRSRDQSKDLCATLLEKGRTCIVFGGYCTTQQKLRAFRIETDCQNQRHKREILINDTDVEIFGTEQSAALTRLRSGATERDIIAAIQAVIDDPAVTSVGGNIQYGSFLGTSFQPRGIAKLDDTGVHYWRGTLDLNGPEFLDQELLPNFPMLDPCLSG